MITTTTIYKHSFCMRFLLCALLLILLPACGGENGPDDPDNTGFEEGVPTEVRITLSARSGNGTRGDGTPKDPTASVELIHDGWWIAFVDQKGNVRIIGQKDDEVTDRIKSIPSPVAGSDETTTDGGFEAETFKIIIPSGTYRVYAFANVPRKTEEEFAAFKKEDSSPWMHRTVRLNEILGDDRFIKDPTDPNADGMQWPSDKNIPMTGVMPKVVIKNTVEEAFNIEVIRAVAKVEFEFTNSSDDEITVTELQFGPITNDDNISFVPNNDAVGIGPNNKLLVDVKNRGTLIFSGLALTPEKLNGTSAGLEFYCKESIPQKDGDPFEINLTIKKNGIEKPSKTLYTNKITYINRNDWIKIPITFNGDWKIIWNLRMYPPIGGYPPVFNQNEDGTALTATVNIGGEFELYPFKVMMGSDTENLASRVDWNKVEVSVESGSDLFTKAPYIDSYTKAIVGELDYSKTGTAKVRIDFYLVESTGVTTKLSCTFTIIRQNQAPSNQ